jgi:LacI family transcriptional regulator
MSRRKATIHDVARAVGVHASTVSRALNPQARHRVSAAVVEQIAAASRRLGYTPDVFAAGLRTRRSNTVGVLIPDIMNPVFPPILRGIEDALATAGCTAIIANTDAEASHDALLLDRLLGRRVDGLILATARRRDAMVDRCLAEGVPLVLINRTVAGRQPVSAVVNDDEAGIGLAVVHLLGLGHRRIAHVAGPQGLSTGHARRQGFLAALKNADSSLIVEASAYSAAAGIAAMAKLLAGKVRFTAVVAANDLLALGCYDALARAGLRCPQDVSVTGFNDMPFADRFSPPLTTVRIQHYEMGRRAGDVLLERLRRRSDTATVTIRLEPSLVVRGSTSPALLPVTAGRGSRHPRQRRE